MNKETLNLNKQEVAIYNIDVGNEGTHYKSFIGDALTQAEIDKNNLENKIEESAATINRLTPQCDKIDYGLAISSGILCGLLDIFLVGKPGESVFGDITDKWYKDKVDKFCKLNGCSDLYELEQKYIVPYDQTTGGPIFQNLMKMTPSNHHFKSLAHNPTLLGLFFSILDQFSTPNLSHFVSNGELIALVDSDSGFVLRGNNVVSKFFCAFANWIGHLISDVSGSSSSKGRGMGLPSPLWTWSNDVIAIKRSLNINASKFDKSVNDLAMKMYLEGYDLRYQTAQAIPVFLNEMITRLLYLIRRLINYFSENKNNYSLKTLWKDCEPFSNSSIKRMLTVSHGMFCLVDISDVLVCGIKSGGGYQSLYEMCMRLNVIGLGRFSISLFGEVNRYKKKKKEEYNISFLHQREAIVQDYIKSLAELSEFYDEGLALSISNAIKDCNFEKSLKESAELSKKRGGKYLETIEDIDEYFSKPKNE